MLGGDLSPLTRISMHLAMSLLKKNGTEEAEVVLDLSCPDLFECRQFKHLIVSGDHVDYKVCLPKTCTRDTECYLSSDNPLSEGHIPSCKRPKRGRFTQGSLSAQCGMTESMFYFASACEVKCSSCPHPEQHLFSPRSCLGEYVDGMVSKCEELDDGNKRREILINRRSYLISGCKNAEIIVEP